MRHYIVLEVRTIQECLGQVMRNMGYLGIAPGQASQGWGRIKGTLNRGVRSERRLVIAGHQGSGFRTNIDMVKVLGRVYKAVAQAK